MDLTNSNPISRLLNSEFRTLQGLRNALRSDIEKTFTKNQLLLKVRKGKRGGGAKEKVVEDKMLACEIDHVLHYLRPGRD